jgi:hypothetical protein
MAIISGIAGVAGRFAGRVLNAVLGWATILLFGKVSGPKQTVVLLIALASVVWVVLVIGVLVPDIGTTLIAFVPVPSFISEDLVRLAMLAAAILLPLVVGIAALAVMDKDQRPKGPALIASVVRGYPFTLLLAGTIVLLGGVALVRRLRALSKRWEDAHVSVIIKPGGYDETLDKLATVLTEGGIRVSPKPAPRVMSAPPKLLAKVAGSGLGSLVPDRLMLLESDQLETLVYPSDVSIVGSKQQVALARALIASQLTHAPAYMTTDADAQKAEDRIRAVADKVGRLPEQALRRKLDKVDEELMSLTVPFDEWEILYRERLQVEREVFGDGRAIGEHQPEGAEGAATDGDRPATPVVQTARSLGAIGLVALAADRLVRRRSSGAR